AERVVAATGGLGAASAMPRAAERPTRRPVKLPGPVVTAMRSSAVKGSADSFITRAISGISASACPRFIACDSTEINLLAPVSSTAAAQASSAVSIARISIEGRLALPVEGGAHRGPWREKGNLLQHTSY